MGDVQGWITIGTRLNSKQLEKQLNQQKRELAKYAKDEEKLLAEKRKNEQKVNEVEEKKNLLEQKRQEDKRRAKSESDPATRRFKLREADMTYASGMAQLDEKYSGVYQTQEELEKKVSVIREKQKLLNGEIDKTSEKYRKVKQEADFEKTGNKIEGIVKKVGRWGLAIFGVRSAYSAVRSSLSTITQYDKQLGKDIEYMKYALSMTLKPVIEWIVNAVKNLMYYADYIARTWFGLEKSIWASADSMNEANDKAKALKKTLLGFDEVNVLGNKEDEKTPSFDLSNGLADKDVPKWIKWIGDHKTEVLAVIGALTGFFLSKKIVNGISLIMGTAGGTGLVGLSALLAELALVGVIAIEIVVLTKGIEKLKTQIEEAKSWQQSMQEEAKKLTARLDESITKFNEQGDAINKTDEEMKEYADRLLLNIDINRDMIDSLEETKSIIGEWTGENQIAIETQDIYRESLRKSIDELGKLYDQNILTTEQAQLYVNAIEAEIKVLENSYDPLRKNTDEMVKNKKEAKELKEKLNDLKGNYDVKVSVNTDTEPAKKGLKKFFTTLGENFVNFILPGNLPYSAILSKIHLLAGGGIIDAPGRGVPLASNVIGGEAGAEAVLPLTNQETMTKLGEEIGKWITLNLDITNTIDGRVLNNRLETIKKNNSFSRNGG